jgi:hypothetical protein
MLHLRETRTRLALIATVVAVALGVTGGFSLFPPRTVDAAVASQPRLEAAAAASKTIAAPDAAALVVDATLKQATPIAAPEPTAAMRTSRTTRSTRSSTTARTASKPAAAKPAGSELSQARSILAGLIAKHPSLRGTTVSFGDARGYQAIALYTSGRIIISPSHTASLSRILNHEVWHIIDWRDNGTIDWGENVPPR